jgi:phenylacetate-CoA ligase
VFDVIGHLEWFKKEEAVALRAIARKVIPVSIRQKLNYVRTYIPPRFRYGKLFWDTYNFLNESEWWSKSRLQEYQLRELNKLLNHAYQNVLYYRKVFDERGLKPKDIQTFDDLKQLPYLAKDIFKENFREIIARNLDSKDLFISHTSGTTGKPLQFYEERSTLQKELAFVRHQWARVDFKPGDPLVGLRGPIIESGRPVEYDPADKVLRLSPRLDTREIVRDYLEMIRRFGASFIHGYPSAISLFAIMVKRYDLPVRFKLRAILFASEIVYPWERQISEEVFNCRVFSHYGMAENAVTAGECECTQYYHCVPQYGITEIDPDSNEIIGTSFQNYANPFIRYRTTDSAWAPIYSGCEKCGRQYFPIFPNIDGRKEDFMITTKELLVSPAVITFPFKDLKTIKGTQLVQKSVDYIKVKIIPWEGSEPEMLERELEGLCENLRNILGSDMKIETEIVERIPCLESGKFKWIISEVSKDVLNREVDEY